MSSCCLGLFFDIHGVEIWKEVDEDSISSIINRKEYTEKSITFLEFLGVSGPYLWT